MDVAQAYESFVFLGFGVGGIVLIAFVLYIKWNIFDRW